MPDGSHPSGSHQPEHGVARAERHAQSSLTHEAQSDQARRVVPRPGDDARRREAVALAPVRGEPADWSPRRHNRRQFRSERGRRCGNGARCPPERRDVHQVHARGVARIERGMRAGEQRGHERADQVHPLRRRVALRLPLGERANLRSRESLERPRTGETRQGRGAAHGRGDGCACLRRARIQPHRRGGAGPDVPQLVHERGLRVKRAEPGCRAVRQVDAAVLLGGPADRADVRERDPASREVGHQQVQGLGPHQRRRVDDPRVGR